nr:transposase [Anaeromyxobacter sp. SG63]
MYVWADGVHFNVRLEDEQLAALVVVGARPDGTKEVVALEDGCRESTESWLALLRDLKKRGMSAPVVAVGDGALGSGRRSARCSRDPGRALLGAYHRQRARQAATELSAEDEGCAARDDERSDEDRVPEAGGGVRDRVDGTACSHPLCQRE